MLAQEGSRLLLISEKGLDSRTYHSDSWEGITWEECDLRGWLNGEFYQSAFSAEEQQQIALMDVKADPNPEFATEAGRDTQDRIFLLSLSEAQTYFEHNVDRSCEATVYASNNHAETAFRKGWWWLRTPGMIRTSAANVEQEGFLMTIGATVDRRGGMVRPAFWLEQ